MNKIENSVLSIEERILLASFEEQTVDRCIDEIDNLALTVPNDDESLPDLMQLRYKLLHFPINILSEIATVSE